ncbi:hypothetical protein [Schlesneria paludicola]|uniref:hypothetical protein n=1 Tax=Schlesneria paludicola TaxID=360056 RepID=UPI00029B12F7|nr:hypothetical protein [Schlesneria paludicola]
MIIDRIAFPAMPEGLPEHVVKIFDDIKPKDDSRVRGCEEVNAKTEVLSGEKYDSANFESDGLKLQKRSRELLCQIEPICDSIEHFIETELKHALHEMYQKAIEDTDAAKAKVHQGLLDLGFIAPEDGDRGSYIPGMIIRHVSVREGNERAEALREITTSLAEVLRNNRELVNTVRQRLEAYKQKVLAAI